MARKEQTLLESIFDAACVIESSLVDQYGKPFPDPTTMDYVKRDVRRPFDVASAKVNNLTNELTEKLGKVREKVGGTAVGRHVIANKKAYKAGAKGGLLGLGLTAAGLGGYAMRDKIAGLLAGHHEDEA